MLSQINNHTNSDNGLGASLRKLVTPYLVAAGLIGGSGQNQILAQGADTGGGTAATASDIEARYNAFLQVEAEINSEVQALQNLRDTLIQEEESLNNENDILNEEIEELSRVNDQLNARAEQANAESASLETDINSYNQEVEAVNQQAEAINAVISAAVQAESWLQSIYDNGEEPTDEQIELHNSYVEQANALGPAIAALEQRQLALDDASQNLDERTQYLEAEINEINSARDHISAEDEAISASYENLRLRAEEFNARCQEYADRHDGLNSRIEQLNSEWADFESEVAALQEAQDTRQVILPLPVIPQEPTRSDTEKALEIMRPTSQGLKVISKVKLAAEVAAALAQKELPFPNLRKFLGKLDSAVAKLTKGLEKVVELENQLEERDGVLSDEVNSRYRKELEEARKGPWGLLPELRKNEAEIESLEIGLYAAESAPELAVSLELIETNRPEAERRWNELVTGMKQNVELLQKYEMSLTEIETVSRNVGRALNRLGDSFAEISKFGMGIYSEMFALSALEAYELARETSGVGSTAASKRREVVNTLHNQKILLENFETNLKNIFGVEF